MDMQLLRHKNHLNDLSHNDELDTEGLIFIVIKINKDNYFNRTFIGSPGNFRHSTRRCILLAIFEILQRVGLNQPEIQANINYLTLRLCLQTQHSVTTAMGENIIPLPFGFSV